MSASTSSTASLFTPLQFTGISQYSTDFQSILSRATSIAELPVKALQNQQSDIQQQEADLTTLSTSATAVTNALKAIGNLTSGGALAASSSDTKVVTATSTGAAAGTSYSITNVTSVASPASEISTKSYANATSTPVSASGDMELVLGGQPYPITLATGSNNLNGLVSAINGLKAGVTASVLTSSSGVYLSLTANNPGNTTLQLLDLPGTLTQASAGSSTVAASATSTGTYADTTSAAVSANGNMGLDVGGKTYAISLGANNNLAGLASAINGLNAGVTATTTGSAGSYQLSITANNPGANTLQLADYPSLGVSNLTQSNPGSSSAPASAASTATYAGLSTAVSASGSMGLVVGGQSYAFSLGANNNLSGLVSAINGLNAGVTATTTGSAGSYQLSITANSPGANTLQLMEYPSGNVINSANQGKNTDFNINGIAVSEPTTVITDVVPGLTLNFSGTTAAAESVSVKVSTDPTQIETALQNLVSSYNALATAEAGQFSNPTTGGSAGSLRGNNILYQVQNVMTSLLQYQGSGTMTGLTALGITMSTTGADTSNQLTFDTAAFSALSASDIAASLQLLGTSTTGIGGLQQTFDAITNSADGAIAEQEHRWSTTSANLSNEISAKTAQIQANEQVLNQQLQAYDALSAELTNQLSMLTASITSLNYTSYGYNTNNTATGG